jgi:hypothetical protein
VADEVIDLLLPVLFYHVRARRWRKLHAEQPAKTIARGQVTPAASTAS